MAHSPYRLFLQNLKKHRGYYALGIFALLVTSTTEIFLPKFIQWSIDLLAGDARQEAPTFFVGESRGDTLNHLVAGLLMILLCGWLGRIGWRQILARQSHLAGHDVKTRIWRVLKDQPLNLLERFSLGDLMNRATADWNKVRFIHGFTIVTVFDLLFFAILSLASMLMIHPQLALLSLLILPLLPRRIIAISRQEYRLHQQAQEKLSRLSDVISQTLKTIRLQRATATERPWLDRLDKDAEAFAERQFEVLRTGWRIFTWAALPSIFAYGVLFSYGILKIQAGELSIGAFVALQSYVLMLQAPLFELGSVISEWQTGFASYQRITELYDLEKPTIATAPDLVAKRYDAERTLTIRDLDFGYDHQRLILRRITLDLRAGEKLGLLGPIGSGKSTLIHVIGGLLPGYEGRIELHGLDISGCGRDWITRNLTLVSQKAFLFAGSIRYNLSPDGRASEAEMIEALRCVELWDDIEGFPEQLDAWIGEWGINLSGGQKQRLALARALLKPAAILMIDDGLSAVDSLTESRILEHLSQRLRHQTMIWSAHRASTLQLCNRILTIDEGMLRPYCQEGAAAAPALARLGAERSERQ